MKRTRYVHETQPLCAADGVLDGVSPPAHPPPHHLYEAVISPIRSRNITYTQPLASTTPRLFLVAPLNANDVSFKRK